MAAAMKLWTRMAEAANCAVLLLHHVRKGLTDADDQQAIRGAGAIVDLARTGLVLTKMTTVEANTLGLEDTRRRRFYFRLGHPKASMAPPPTQAEWYQLISVKIGNPDDEYPEGDNVQAVERWHPPSLFAGIDRSIAKAIFDKLRDGPEPGERYSFSTRGRSNDRWAGNVIMELAKKNTDQAKAILSEWKNKGVLKGETYKSTKTRKDALGVTLVEAKVAAIVNQTTPYDPDC